MRNEIRSREPKELSANINVITAEINAYQRVAGEAIFEIGRRLKGVRENPEKYGFEGYRDWERWCEGELNITRQHANRFIKIVERFGNTGVPTLPNTMSVLYELTTFTDEQLEQEYELPNGEKKKPIDMSRRQIEELKQQLKETEKQAEAERKERERLEQENEELSSREPEVITEYIEKESEELYDRMYDRPFGVERTNDFYEMMNEVDELYRKYAHLKDSIEEIGAIAKYDDDLKKRYKQAQDLWVMLDSIFNNNNDIIDVEII